MFDAAISTRAELNDLTREQETKAVLHSEEKKLDGSPWPVGGWASVGRNLKLPSDAKGRVSYEFYLNPEGKVMKVTILDGVNTAVNAAVEKAIYATPFHPAIRSGRAVAVHLRHYIDIDVRD